MIKLMELKEPKFKTVLETIFIPFWNTIAHICKGGEIYISFIQGRFHTKEQIREALGTGWKEDFYKQREDLFDEIYEYYLTKYK